MSQTEIHWDDLRVFLAVSRAGALQAAARTLGVDRSTVSRRIEALEAALGARLFLRTREGLRISAAGERLLSHAEAVEAGVRELVTAARTDGDEIEGCVRVATTEGLAVRLVTMGLLDVTVAFPRLQIDLLAGNRPVDLSRGEADLALRTLRPEASSLKIRTIARFGVSLFAAPSYLRHRGVPRDEAQLAGHDVLLPAYELAALPEAAWLAAVPGVRVALRSSSLPSLAAAAVRGHGLVPLTDPWGDAEPGLERVLPLTGVEPRPIYLAVEPRAADRAAVRVVADRIVELFARFGSRG